MDEVNNRDNVLMDAQLKLVPDKKNNDLSLLYTVPQNSFTIDIYEKVH